MRSTALFCNDKCIGTKATQQVFVAESYKRHCTGSVTSRTSQRRIESPLFAMTAAAVQHGSTTDANNDQGLLQHRDADVQRPTNDFLR